MTEVSVNAGAAIVLADIGITEEDAEKVMTLFGEVVRDSYNRDGVAGVVELLRQEQLDDPSAAQAFLKGFVLGSVYIEMLDTKMGEFFDAGRCKEK